MMVSIGALHSLYSIHELQQKGEIPDQIAQLAKGELARMALNAAGFSIELLSSDAPLSPEQVALLRTGELVRQPRVESGDFTSTLMALTRAAGNVSMLPRDAATS